MSIWSSLNLPGGREPFAGDEDACDEYGNRNPRNLRVDVAVAHEQTRLGIWPEFHARNSYSPSMTVLLLHDDLVALRDLLNMAIERNERMVTPYDEEPKP